MTLVSKHGALQTRDVKKLTDDELLHLLRASTSSGGPKFEAEELAELGAEVKIRRQPALDARLKAGRVKELEPVALTPAEKQVVREANLNAEAAPTKKLKP